MAALHNRDESGYNERQIMREHIAPSASHPVKPDYVEYLRDESRLVGRADTISFPATRDELQEALRALAAAGTPVTLQGGRTGITGGAVPLGGHVLNLSRLNRFLGLRHEPEGNRFLLAVEPGVLLSDLREAVTRKEFPTQGWSQDSLDTLELFRRQGAYFLAPDPTESTASVGGAVSTNASGALSFAYGPTRRYVASLGVLLADGSALSLRRGGQRAEGLQYRLQAEGGRTLEGRLPSYRMPQVKHAAGLYVEPDMELMDLLIGSEGVLGVFAQVELLLLPLPEQIQGVMSFFPQLSGALSFAERMRSLGTAGAREGGPAAREGGAAAIELFDANALVLLRSQKKHNPAFAELPDLPPAEGAIYVEIHAEEQERAEALLYSLAEALAACGADPEASWIAEHPRELERLKELRHALPEAVNLLIDERRKADPAITKLATDMAVPCPELNGVVSLFQRSLEEAGLQYLMFGHVGDCHVHVNILPRGVEEYRKGNALYQDWARAVVDRGGTISAEHGVGKLKVPLLRILYGEQGLEEIRAVIETFNPGFRLNRGNMVGWGG
jgi:D-lactate dehydrogenase (cytochrome)